MRLALGLVLFVLAPVGIVSADSLPPPMPIDCPAPTIALNTHCGMLCTLDRCDDDADCRGGRVCGSLPFCAEGVGCGGWGASFWRISSTCEAGCVGDTCVMVHGCVPAPDAGPPAPIDAGREPPRHVRWDCGCRASRRPGVPSFAFVFVLALVGGIRCAITAPRGSPPRPPPGS